MKRSFMTMFTHQRIWHFLFSLTMCLCGESSAFPSNKIRSIWNLFHSYVHSAANKAFPFLSSLCVYVVNPPRFPVIKSEVNETCFIPMFTQQRTRHFLFSSLCVYVFNPPHFSSFPPNVPICWILKNQLISPSTPVCAFLQKQQCPLQRLRFVPPCPACFSRRADDRSPAQSSMHQKPLNPIG